MNRHLRRRFTRLLPLLLVSVVIACGDGNGGVASVSGPGTLTATLISPNGAEGGLLVRLFGPGIEEPEAADGDLFTSTSGDTIRVLLLRESAGQLSFRFAVADTTRPPTVQILQVAGGDNQPRSLVGYELRLAQ